MGYWSNKSLNGQLLLLESDVSRSGIGMKKFLLVLLIFMSFVSYCQNRNDTIFYEPISVTDTLFNLQSKINQSKLETVTKVLNLLDKN